MLSGRTVVVGCCCTRLTIIRRWLSDRFVTGDLRFLRVLDFVIIGVFISALSTEDSTDVLDELTDLFFGRPAR